MDIACVYSLEDFSSIKKPLPGFSDIPMGIASIATMLKHAGHNPTILVITPYINIHNTLETYINNNSPSLFCLSAISSQFYIIKKIAKAIKHINPSIHTLLGGHQATLHPQDTILEPYIDAICIGEGELAAVEYANQIEQNGKPTGIHNLWIKTNGKVERNEQDLFMQDLDGLPFVDRSLWKDLVADTSGVISILVGRGCPHRCTYCSNHALAKISKGKYVRFRKPENILQELNEIVCHYPEVSNVCLEIEDFGINVKFTDELCDKLIDFNASRKRPIAFNTNTSPNRTMFNNETMLIKMKKANFNFIKLGLESGSEKIRNEILRRPKHSNKDIIGFCSLLRKHGFHISIFLLMGIPGETLNDFRETIACVKKCKPNHVLLSIYYPIPGTDLFYMAQEMGLFSGEIDPTAIKFKVKLDLPGFSKRRIFIEYLLFPYRVFRGRKPIHMILAHMLRWQLVKYPLLNSYFRRLTNTPALKPIKMKLSPNQRIWFV